MKLFTPNLKTKAASKAIFGATSKNTQRPSLLPCPLPYLFSWLAMLLLASCNLPVWAAEKPMSMDSMPDMTAPMTSPKTTTMDHSKMAMAADDATAKQKTASQLAPAMQGGSAPANARDPHAYSGGYSIESGKYSLPGPRQLVLADEYNFGMLLFNRLEFVNTSDNNTALYDMQAWYGRDYDRLVIKAEGDITDGSLEESSTEILWGHAIATYWDAQLGIRFDSGEAPSLSWLAFGVQGLAPYWFEVDISGYIGEGSRGALALEFEYEILFSQKLILQPRFEGSLYSKDDIERGIGSGLSDAAAGLRLRYEFYREFAPYVGIEWAKVFGDTADMARAANQNTQETRYVAGMRIWF